MAGTVGFKQGHRGPDPSVICQTPPSAEAGRWNPEARGPSAQFGASGRVVRSTASFGRRQCGAKNVGHFEGIDKPSRRPPVARHELSQEILRSEPVEPFELDGELDGDALFTCLRTARKGAAPGPSGMTADHLFPILESEADSEQLEQVASNLAVADVPVEVIDGIRLGLLTALAKPDGGVRGFVIGDIVRRLVARTIAKQFAKRAEVATAPFQCAFSTKAGCECVAHIVQALTDQDANATVVTVDGVGAVDLISRSPLLEGLLRMENRDQVFPFARCFHGSPSTCLWEDEMENTQEIPQGKGGEQGNVLIGRPPVSRGHPAETRRWGEVVGICCRCHVICRPERVRSVVTIIDEEHAFHAHVNIHHGKTQVWNRGGVAPGGMRPQTESFAVHHDQRGGFMKVVLGVEGVLGTAQAVSQLPLLGGLSLTSQHIGPGGLVEIAETLIVGNDQDPSPCLAAVRNRQGVSEVAGLDSQPWRVLADTPPMLEHDADPTEPKRGWQHRASQCLEVQHFRREVGPTLADPNHARSQRAPLASAALTALPTSWATRIDPQFFRVWLCRRLFLPLL